MSSVVRSFLSAVSFRALLVLIFFLPFSAWLISITGFVWLTVIRDILVVGTGLYLFEKGKKSGGMSLKNSLTVMTLVVITWVLLSYFWKDASTSQWLRGVRYDVVPLLFLFFVSGLQLNDVHRRTLLRLSVVIGVVVLLGAFLQLIGVHLPLESSYSGIGALNAEHLVGQTSVVRVFSFLAGPNALALYLISLGALMCLYWRKSTFVTTLAWSAVVAGIILTFSRSSLIGLVVFIVLYSGSLIKQKWGMKVAGVTVLTLFLIGLGVSAYILKTAPDSNFITHAGSTPERIEQYKRILDTKSEIGLFGYGAGAAGPSSYQRLDGGPNLWSENIYMDVFQQYGLIGLLLFLTWGLFLLKALLETEGISPNIRVGAMLLVSLAVSGLFINITTGQVGWYVALFVWGYILSSSQPSHAR